ncbi:RHS repeat domain-containing protein [Spartinivicinus poritis]|uniref:RHS domain-containing protein n=1 Tax=Spartinivicinus poritis TaxID=2994640 RepID=A0ABT5UGR2_9GAMM|nr:RHS repeat-associated core domain-containing protein [Spartinivicinus sp. A2-2]MDE1465577.1 RHS domain-containing protein [Spartinivicinus sp. A2-2]
MKNLIKNTANKTWQVALAACLLMLTQIVSAANTVEITTYYHNDHTGTPVAATDENGNVLWREDYSPYGEQLTQDPKAATNRRGFTGHVQDRDLGLVYMQARYYDPVLGRFMAIDPVGVEPEASFAFNRYAYGNNNPYKFIDPDGNSPLSYLTKMGAKKVSKGTLNNYVETQIKGKIKKIGNDRFRKRFAKEANELEGMLEDSWQETAIGFIPLVGDVYDAARVPKQISDAFKKAEKLEKRVKKILDIQGKKASELIRGKFKNVEGYPTDLEGKTYNELLKMNSKGADLLKKLIREEHRLGEKV